MSSVNKLPNPSSEQRNNRYETCFTELIPRVNRGGRAEAKIQLFWYMVMLHIKFNGTTHTVTWKQICAAIFKSFIIIHHILSLKLPPSRFKFAWFLENINSVLAKTGCMQSIGLKA